MNKKVLRRDIAEFAERTMKCRLYPYQSVIIEAILDSIIHNKGLTFTVMLARQMGKNQISAIVDAFLLFSASWIQQGTIVKVAPTFKPQVVNSHVRLRGLLRRHPEAEERIWESYGYMIGAARTAEGSDAKVGPHVMFFSADRASNVMGATASLLLEIDEAQDVSIDKFNREFRPMCSSTNATTVLYGTAWTEDSLLATVKAANLELEKRDGIQRHFQYDWQTLAEINSDYKAFVEQEILRLGEEDETIRTQYRLLPRSGAGNLLGDSHRHLLAGQHKWLDEPDENDEGFYVAGIDVGGEIRPSTEVGTRAKKGKKAAQGTGALQEKKDATVISIARVKYDESDSPTLQIVHQYWFTGMLYGDQYATISRIIQQWDIRKVVVDATGLGEGLASSLLDRFSNMKVRAFKFSRSSKSSLTFLFLGVVGSGRLQLYRRDGAPEEIYDECWKQLRRARYRVPAEHFMDMYVPSEEGHDDFLISLALCCEATKEKYVPIVDSGIIPPWRYPRERGFLP